MKEKLD